MHVIRPTLTVSRLVIATTLTLPARCPANYQCRYGRLGKRFAKPDRASRAPVRNPGRYANWYVVFLRVRTRPCHSKAQCPLVERRPHPSAERRLVPTAGPSAPPTKLPPCPLDAREKPARHSGRGTRSQNPSLRQFIPRAAYVRSRCGPECWGPALSVWFGTPYPTKVSLSYSRVVAIRKRNEPLVTPPEGSDAPPPACSDPPPRASTVPNGEVRN